MICPAQETASTPPTAPFDGCTVSEVGDLRLYQRMVWLIGEFPLPQGIASHRPVGFFWNAKAASEVFVNGHFVGRNGVPGADATAEQPGALDATFFVPRDHLNDGPNTVAIRASFHHGWWPTQQPLLVARFGHFRAPPYHGRSDYWISLLTFGVFVVSAIYFGASAGFAINRTFSATLCVLRCLPVGNCWRRSVGA
ncbi:MAG: hypothetical protein AAFX85_19925, partial [Pseudomonadota bacterium]